MATARAFAENSAPDLDTFAPTIPHLRVAQPHAQPFLKWVGGKGKLIAQLEAYLPKGRLRYAEPFFGGGALFFHLWSQQRLDAAVLADRSAELINACKVLRDEADELLQALGQHEALYLGGDAAERSAYFYAVRAQQPLQFALTPVQRAARMLFLNRTCFNGLWRENSRGLFNSPHGRYPNPTIVLGDRLRVASQALGDAAVLQSDFRALPELVQDHRADFVYLDPPYHPLSVTSSFNAYSGGQFSAQAQRDLADVCQRLDRAGVRFLLSNSDCGFIRELYGKWQIDTVRAARSINAKGDSRGEIDEVVVRNYAN